MNQDAKNLFSATATPLASIFGSGFLVIVPILAGAVGPYAWLAMICVCGLAYAMGSVIRFNIRNTEPLLEAGTASHRAAFFERSSDLALVIAAVLSQFSAAVADTIGSGGNMVEATKQHVDDRHAYLLICGVAILVAFFNTLTVLALASRAFAFYYTLQCLVAFNVSKRPAQRFGIVLVAAALAFITLFAVPAG